MTICRCFMIMCHYDIFADFFSFFYKLALFLLEENTEQSSYYS